MISNQQQRQSPHAEAISVEMLEALKQGDHEAFGKVFVRYYNKIRHFIGALVKSDADAEELTQEIFANLWHKREQINTSRNFNAYLYTQARNAALNLLRAQSVRYAYACEVWALAAESENTDEVVMAKEMELLVKVAVANMPTQRRAIYEMSREQGLSNAEIAQKLDISRNAVEKQLRLALGDIREVISLFIAIMLFN